MSALQKMVALDAKSITALTEAVLLLSGVDVDAVEEGRERSWGASAEAGPDDGDQQDA